ncbi:DeoR/GlpR family DNA-binding transcription regulator [Propionibacteriaceae bacterium Y1923]|uniref:DeoR/GlpR family DNA-binding transcription regulator n=1 Tax=Aestuariimicrobium sp. Y1814 TaxID=3418742 RepID=UPI003C13DBDE
MNTERVPRATRPSSKQQRLVAMAERVLERGAVPMQELADYFGVTRMTVYRDVAELEAAGVVFLRHGAAVAGSSSFTETSHAFRVALNASAKRAMCEEVRGHIRPGSTVFLDDSSTVIPLVGLLAEQAPITVLTNSQAVAAEASKHAQLRLFVAGGNYRPTYDSYAGETTLSVLRGLSADFCVMSSTVINQGILYHPVEENAVIKRVMMERSRARFLLADASKFGHRATHEVVPVDDFDLLVTTTGVSAAELAKIACPVVTV